MKKLTSLVMTILLLAALLAGCGSGQGEKSAQGSSGAASGGTSSGSTVDESGVAPVGTYPIVNDKITLSIMGRKDPGAPDWSELEVFKRLSEITNIDFTFELAEHETWSEQKNIALVGGEYPDIIMRDSSTDAVLDEETYGPQGIFLDLTELIDKYAPNLKALLESRSDIRAGITALDGKIYGLPYAFETATTQGHIGFFDSMWMENAGITKVPETVDELYDMLVAFKETDANGNGDTTDEIPFTCVGLESTIRDLLIPAFTGTPDGLSFSLKDGEVVYTPAMPEYKEFLIYANKLYQEGLLDPEFSTQTTQQWQAKAKSGISGVYSGSPTVRDAETTTTQQLSLPPLTSSTNTEKIVKRPINLYPGRAFITDKCQNPEAAMRLLDMFYASTDNAVEGFSGQTLFMGFEDEQWKYTDDTKTAYEWIAPITSFADINQTISVNMELPGYLNFMAMPSGNPLMENKVEQVTKMQVPYYTDGYPQNARFTTEESERGAVIENDLYSYVLMMSTKFIVGEEPIENFDNYLDTLDKTGLQELLAIKVAAYERWQSVTG